ncbi:hypothetical protein HXX76_013439 [Chlamydomonas incerta]|uniref:Uncharacterized protein n=1 Tax=Chlamydomonas incerta TaxID=51695 RepID=A0A835SF35_CHLIN|nr:hypothetical protein HXX76_013439 [Chlamydomonas incerta]|eukprot:KAG2425814.1 hypothetical protein HXX76_013439 [Chlamydomonas incerta]
MPRQFALPTAKAVVAATASSSCDVEQAIRAGLELQRVVVPALNKWQRQTHARAAQFLQVEDDLGERELQRRLGQLAAFAESARALDACFLALKGRINLPYKRALLNAYDTVIDEDVPDLMAINELEEKVAWGTPGSGAVPYLANPLQGAFEMPEWLASECGVPVSLDFQLMGHIWADAAAYYALFAMTASNPDRDEYGLRMGDECFVGPLEDKAAKLLLPSYPRFVPISDPAVQRGTWLVLASLQRLALWVGSSVQARFPLVVHVLQGMMRKAGIARLDSTLAPLDARAVLAGTPFLPAAAAAAAAAAPAARATPQAPAQQQVRAPAAAAAAAQQQQQQPAAAATRALEAAASDSEEEEFEDAEEDSAAGGATAAAGASGVTASADAAAGAGEGGAEAGAAGPSKKKKKKKNRRKKKKAPQQQPGEEAAAGELGAAATQLSPMEALLAALAKEQPDCMVCLQEWGQDLTINQTNFLSCTVLSASGPFHAICNTCWNSLTDPKCPMCNKFDTKALSPAEFLGALSTGRHRA